MIDLRNRKRLVIISLGIFFLFSVLIFQFFKLQVIDGEKWSQAAKRQHFFAVKEPFKRGAVWSNTLLKKEHPEPPLRYVFDIQKFHLYIDPIAIPDKERNSVVDFLISALNLTKDEKTRLQAQFFKKSRNRKIASWLDHEQKEKILKWWRLHCKKNKLPGNALYFVADYKRSYPFGKILGQVLHTVQGQRDETTQQPLPTGGLELAFDAYLKGKPGRRVLKRSPRHYFETGQIINDPEDGSDLYLTINHYIQAIAEEELEKGVKKCEAKCGWAVMMNPHTGEILAYAQYPFFSPARYWEYFNDPEKIEYAKIKGITDAHEPGSVMKPITGALALLASKELVQKGEKRLIDPEEMVPCLDGSFPGRQQPLHDTHSHKYLNMNMAIQKSSNIYWARMAQRIVERKGVQWYRDSLQKVFGFGTKTGIELPSESSGVLPVPGKFHPNGKPEWSGSTPYSLAMGHNLQVTSMQLLRAHAVIANGGFLIEPTIIKKIVKPDGKVVKDHSLKKSFPRVLDKEIANRIAQGMKYVTKFGGTARRADIWGFTEAGKTGTANKIIDGTYSKNKYVASFIGFAPAENPEFILIVVVDEPACKIISGLGANHHGGLACAPVFKEIAKRTLEYLGVSPDDPYGYPKGDPRHDDKKGNWAIETRRLQEIYEKWNK